MTALAGWKWAVGLTCGLPLTGACTAWTRAGADLTPPIPERRAVQVWTDTGSTELHGVLLLPDRISGVRLWHSPRCDSCRIAVVRAAIDSIRVRAYSPRRTGFTVGGAVAFGVAGGVLSNGFCDRQDCTGDVVQGALASAGIVAVLGYLVGYLVTR
jgi:hypothetical protein